MEKLPEYLKMLGELSKRASNCGADLFVSFEFGIIKVTYFHDQHSARAIILSCKLYLEGYQEEFDNIFSEIDSLISGKERKLVEEILNKY
jgi:hypothetical protein